MSDPTTHKMKTLIYENNLFGKSPIGITNGRIVLKECLNSTADKIIKQHHYSKTTTKNRFKSFSINKDKGYLQLGYGIRPHMKHTISSFITKDNYCEFDRMWVSDELPKNSESQIISLLLSYIKQVYKHIDFIITYADEAVGNVGTIYKATNAIILGSVPADFYVLEDGTRVHPVTMWHRHKTRAKSYLEGIYPNIKHIKGQYKQFRFLYILRKKYQERYVRSNGKARGSSSVPLHLPTHKRMR